MSWRGINGRMREVMNSALMEVWTVSIFSLLANNFAINFIVQKFLKVGRSDLTGEHFFHHLQIATLPCSSLRSYMQEFQFPL